VQESGFNPVKVSSSIHTFKGISLGKLINKITLGFFEEFFTVQYFVKAIKGANESN
jgi:hypothetical protein